MRDASEKCERWGEDPEPEEIYPLDATSEGVEAAREMSDVGDCRTDIKWL